MAAGWALTMLGLPRSFAQGPLRFVVQMPMRNDSVEDARNEDLRVAAQQAREFRVVDAWESNTLHRVASVGVQSHEESDVETEVDEAFGEGASAGLEELSKRIRDVEGKIRGVSEIEEELRLSARFEVSESAMAKAARESMRKIEAESKDLRRSLLRMCASPISPSLSIAVLQASLSAVATHHTICTTPQSLIFVVVFLHFPSPLESELRYDAERAGGACAARTPSWPGKRTCATRKKTTFRSSRLLASTRSWPSVSKAKPSSSSSLKRQYPRMLPVLTFLALLFAREAQAGAMKQQLAQENTFEHVMSSL